MNDFTAKPNAANPNPKPSSALALSLPHRKPAGCIAIFFKLFDWNRRFGNTTNNKHFPKKLLPHAPLNPVSNKFNADEKLPLPKHRTLIGDKKGSVFPAMDTHLKGGGCVSLDQRRGTKSPGLVARLMGLESMPLVHESDKESGNLEKKWSTGRNELQPQKIQKTGVSERRPISRLGGDAFQIKNALSRSRKRHPKLLSPVKSPRKSSSRLIDAAARILEPGLHSRNRAKCSLTYSHSIPEEHIVIDRYNVCSNSSSPHGFNAQSSCLNCRHSTDSVNHKSGGISETQPSSRHYEFFHRVEEKRPRPGKCNEKESQVVLLRSRHQLGNPEAVSPDAQNISSSHPERVVSPSLALKHRVRSLPKSQPVIFNCEEKSSVRPRRALNHSKDFIALNRNVSQPSVRHPSELSHPTQDNRHNCIPRNNGLSTHKNLVRRTTTTCKQAEYTNSYRLPIDRQRNMKSRVVTGNKSANPKYDRKSTYGRGNGVSLSKNIDAVSFTFSSPLKSKSSSFSPSAVDNYRKNGDMVDEDSQGEDAIGAFLQQKLKELTHQAEYESATTLPHGRSSASILQEVISALTAEKRVSPDSSHSLSSSPAVIYTTSQVRTRTKQSLVRFSGDRHSPGSVLDASFSNDSCVSSSRDDASGHMVQSDDMDVSYEEPLLLYPDADLVDSASSSSVTRDRKIVPVTNLLDHISNLLERANVSNYTSYTNEVVLLKAEMLFGNPVGPERFVDFLLGSFLDEVERLAAAAWRSTVILGFDVSKGGDEQNPLRAFLLDCLVECLHLRYASCSDCGFRKWSKLPTMSTQALLQVFDYEVRRWTSLAVMDTDDVIIWEMSTLEGKWTDFDLEAFESGAQVSQGIFQSLVDEVVADFLCSQVLY